MKIKFLGTKGEDIKSSKSHKKESGVLIGHYLFDLGRKEYLKYKPSMVFITHLHPDHAYFIKDKIKLDILIVAPEEPDFVNKKKWLKVKGGDVFKDGPYTITVIPTIHSKKVKSVAYLIEFTEGFVKQRVLYTGDLIWIKKRYQEKIRNLNLVITDGSFIREGGMIRRDKETGEIYGHSGIPNLIKLFRDKLKAKKIIFTHFGDWLTKNEEKGHKKLKELGVEYAIDNMSLEVGELQLKPEDVKAITKKEIAKIKAGLYLVEPHGKMIWDGSKTLIVKSKRFTEHIKEELFLFSDNLCYGIIYLEEPKEITKEEFDKLRNRHRITEEEYRKWKWKEPLYAYEFRFRRYEPPIPVKIPKGVQVFVNASKVKFLEPKELSLLQLEWYHALSHVKSIPCLHYMIAYEIENRGYPHSIRSIMDRKYQLLIKDWKTYNPSKIEDAVLRDDWRIVNAWYSRLTKEKKPFTSPQFEKYSLKEQIKIVRDLMEKIRKEMIRRGWKPKAILFELPKGMGIEDIDIQYVTSLSNKELIDLWNYLVEEAESIGKVNEPLQNAGIFVGIELLKRGLWIENKGDNILTREIELEVEEYPTPKGFASEIEYLEEKEPEGDYISIEDIYDNAPNQIIVPGQPFAIYQTGRMANEGKIPKGHDIDWVFRQYPDRRVVEALRRSRPKWLFKIVHPVFDPSGPLIGFSYPLYRYGFFKVKKEEFIRGFGPYRPIQELKAREIKPFMRFRALKAKAGWGKNEFWKYQDLWDSWASKYIDRGIIVQKKYDGRRFTIHKLGDKVEIVTEDRQRDRSSEMPNVVKTLKDIRHDFVLDAEMVAYDCKGKQVKTAYLKSKACEEIPREDTAWATVGKISPEQEASMVFHVHDILYLDGKSLNNKGYYDRFKILASGFFSPKNPFFTVVQSSGILETPGAFKREVQRLRTMKGSEGVMLKVADSIYPGKTEGENRTPEWAKLKNLKSIDVIVYRVVPKRESKTGKPIPGQYMYDTAIAIPKEEVKQWRPSDLVEVKGKVYAKIGRTFSTATKANVGDIIEVLVGRIREYTDKKTGKHYITWMFPKFRELRKDKSEPDSLDTARKLAKVGPEFIEKLYERIVTIKLKKCPFYKNTKICPLKIRFGMPRIHRLSRMRIEYLKYPIACPLANLFKCQYVKGYYYGFKEWRRRKL